MILCQDRRIFARHLHLHVAHCDEPLMTHLVEHSEPRRTFEQPICREITGEHLRRLRLQIGRHLVRDRVTGHVLEVAITPALATIRSLASAQQLGAAPIRVHAIVVVVGQLGRC